MGADLPKILGLENRGEDHYFFYNTKDVQKKLNVEESVKSVSRFTGYGMRFWRLLGSSNEDKTEKIASRVFDEFKKGNLKQGIGDLRYASDEEMKAFIKKCKKDKSGIGKEILQIFNEVKIGKTEGAGNFEAVAIKFKKQECEAAKIKVIKNIEKFNNLCIKNWTTASSFYSILSKYANCKIFEISELLRSRGFFKIENGLELLKAANECHSTIDKYKKNRYELEELEQPSNRGSLYSAEIEAEDFEYYFYMYEDYEDMEIEPLEERGSVSDLNELEELPTIEEEINFFFDKMEISGQYHIEYQKHQ